MLDRYNRQIDYLRISLTDKCNMRCIYCMPESGIECFTHEEILTFEEIKRIVGLFCDCGIRKIRLTGGECFVRKDFLKFLSMLSSIDGVEDIGITTNGLMLAEHAAELMKNKVNHVNISIDSLDSVMYHRLTRTDALDKVLAGMDICYDMGFDVKINSLILKGYNEGDIIPLALIAKDRKINVRFIELMPIGCGKDYEGMKAAEILEALKGLGEYHDKLSYHGSGPARYIHIDGFAGDIGFIDPLTCKFCSTCNRMRLTSDGKIKPCLYSNDRYDLRSLLRSGVSDEDIKEFIRNSIYNKPLSHRFEDAGTDIEKSKMSSIGG